MPNDAELMAHALKLARLGEGRVEPNPQVGAVVADAAGRVVGTGFHAAFGGPHAEVVALAAAGESARGGTLYVTLEPCCHHGKTPPCTDAVLRSGVGRVVAAVLDPNPLVAGKGVAELRAAGVTADVGLLGREADDLIAPFARRVTTGLPWVIGKWAMTLDGKIAATTGDSRWVSGEESRADVHTLRGRVDAVVVGAGTVWADDPLLTARPPGPRRATRVVLTRSGRLPGDCQLTRTATEVPIVVFTETPGAAELRPWRSAGCEVMTAATLTPEVMLRELGRRGMTNVLLEAGPRLLGAFADADALDEAWVYLAPKLVGGPGNTAVTGVGVPRMADARAWGTPEVTPLGPDVRLRTRRVRQSPVTLSD